MPPDARSPLVNRRYLVLDALGRGGMGRVFRAFDRATERVVALKTPHDLREGGPGHPLVEEYRLWSSLVHPNIVRAIDLERSRRGPLPRGTPFLILERAAGLPAHRVLAPGRSGYRTLRAFARGALRALAHVHDAGLVHRDLKPGNLLVAAGPRDGVRVQLTDFGLAATRGSREEAGRISGSLPYVAPETILGGAVDGRTDLYGLGVLLHFLSTGRLPFETERPEEILRWHLDGETGDPCTARPDLPSSWGRFVRRLAARPPSDRPRDAHAALAMLGCGAASRRPSSARGAEVATLRLAVDAVRLGGVRTHDLPSGAAGRALLREARTVAGALDVDLIAIDGSASGGSAPDLARAVTLLLAADFEDFAAVARRHRLEDGLPLEILGGIAVWDRAGRGDPDEAAVRAAGRGVAALLLDAARRRPRVVAFGRAALADPVARAVVERLESAATAMPAPRPGAPGLLLLRPPPEAVARRTDRRLSPRSRRDSPHAEATLSSSVA